MYKKSNHPGNNTPKPVKIVPEDKKTGHNAEEMLNYYSNLFPYGFLPDGTMFMY